jgi:hypothetical protein
VTDVANSENQDAAQLLAADEQLLRELTERARTGGLQLTGQGGLLGEAHQDGGRGRTGRRAGRSPGV